MKLLFDTHTLLWFLSNHPKLSRPASQAITDPSNERWLSPISLLEIALKVRIRKLSLQVPFATLFPTQLFANRIEILPLTTAQIELLTRLPLHHRDPFDRLLAATAIVENMTLVSVDTAFDSYGLARLW